MTTKIYILTVIFIIIACLKISAVCTIPQRKCGKFRAPPDDLYYVHQMYVNVPGQYNVVTSVKPNKANNYNHTYTKELGTILLLDSHDSDDDFCWKVDDIEAGIDENYNIKYDQDDSSESTPPNRNLNLSKEVIEINEDNNNDSHEKTGSGNESSNKMEVIEIKIGDEEDNTNEHNDKVSE